MTPETTTSDEKHGLRAAQFSHSTIGGRACLVLELTDADGVRGQARVPATAGLAGALGEAVRALNSGARNLPPPRTTEKISDERTSDEAREVMRARGAVEAARADILCQRHGVSLHRWLGGPVRREVQVTLPLILPGAGRNERSAAIERETTRAKEASRACGITSFALHDASRDIGEIADAAAAIRRALGSEPSLALRLQGQLDAKSARTLFERLRASDLRSVSDPCESMTMNMDAGHARLPALALSAARYDRKMLLACLSAVPPAVLIVNPLLEGGPMAVRRLASIARVVQTDISLTAFEGGPWLAGLCAELAAALPACHEPIELPPDAITSVTDGTLRPSSAPPELAATGTGASSSGPRS